MVMITGVCDKSDCTVTETGKCLELHGELTDCPHFGTHGTRPLAPGSTEVGAEDDDESPATGRDPDVSTPHSPARQFHAGIELGTSDAAEIMRSRYTHVIAILGPTNAGKTCLLSSLYLMASRGDLHPRHSFAGSMSLQGFEDRARRLRRWTKGVLPDKLSEHTILSDPRSPAFMHLALQAWGVQGGRIDLLLSDLPGEWSTNLIDRADAAARFAFLKRADGIIFVIESQRLRSNTERHNEIQRAKLMLQRLAQTVSVNRDLPLVFLISKCDVGGMEVPRGFDRIESHAVSLGFKPVTILAAAFSREPALVRSGTGVMEAVEAILNYEIAPPDVTPPRHSANPTRSFARFQLA